MPGRYQFTKSGPCGVSRRELADWHFRAGAIHRLIPPWEKITVVREAAPLVDGACSDCGLQLE